MYLGVDIGGTKTLVASFDAEGKLLEKDKFPTGKDYQTFLTDLAGHVANMSTKDFASAAVAVPGLLDRDEGVVVVMGNLPWRNEHIRDDIAAKLNLPVVIENDARTGGLAEAGALKGRYREVLYLTVGTGIGGALLQDGQIVKELQDTEMGKMPLYFNGKLLHWEEFAGGRGIVNRFGERASEITDPEAWKEIGLNLAHGVGVLCSVLQTEVIVFGGGIGQYAEHFIPTVKAYLEKELHPLVRQPKALLKTEHPSEEAIYGCYELARMLHEKTDS